MNQVNPTTVAIIQSSWEFMVQNGMENMMCFYDRLFQIAPHLKPFFPEDLSKQSEKLAYTFSFVATNIDRIDEITESIEELGRTHNKLHILAEHYPPLNEALIWTIQQKMGDQYTDEIGEAWESVLNHLSEVMISAKPIQKTK